MAHRHVAPRALFTCLLVLPISMAAQGQTEITPLVSWAVGGSASVPRGTVALDNGLAYGAVLGARVEKDVNVEFTYEYLPTKGHFNSSSGTGSRTLDMSVHLLQFGAAYHVLTDRIQPFMSTTAGAVLFRPNGGAYGSDFRLAFSAIFGIKFFPADNVGLRLQARVLLPVYFSQGGFWSRVEGTGGGINSGIRMVQPDLGGGIVIAF